MRNRYHPSSAEHDGGQSPGPSGLGTSGLGSPANILGSPSVKKPPPPRRRRGQSLSPAPPMAKNNLQSQSQSQLQTAFSPIASASSNNNSNMPQQQDQQQQQQHLVSSASEPVVKTVPPNQFENWVMVYGYPLTNLDRGLNVILQDFLRYGDIEEHDYKIGNYLFIRYRRSEEADAALMRDGRPLPNDPESVIGVQRVTPELLGELGRTLNGVVGAVSNDSRSAGAYSAVRRYDTDINLAPQRRQGDICSRIIELIFSW